ncbi:membrane protein DedA with SNARE-associated domain [Undibacterium sp. GrIS 1.8]|uniref:hypothetical protein n=1 Tax=Undibacterium sp. GrIS 1.8 TaxID=3143934 RepID=UPI0033946D3A
MHPLLMIFGVLVASVLALILCFFGLSFLGRWFGQDKVERFAKFRLQGPFVPVTPAVASAHDATSGVRDQPPVP